MEAVVAQEVLTIESLVETLELIDDILDDDLDSESLFELLRNEDLKFYSCRKDTELVGYAFTTKQSTDTNCTLDFICIHPDNRDLGLGGLLLRKVMECSPNLELFVSTTNEPALALYESHGFKRGLMYPKYYGYDGEYSSNAYRMTSQTLSDI